MDNVSDKTEGESTDEEKIQGICEQSLECDLIKNKHNANEMSNDVPGNPSVDSSTDTLIPSSEPGLLIPIDAQKDLYVFAPTLFSPAFISINLLTCAK